MLGILCRHNFNNQTNLNSMEVVSSPSAKVPPPKPAPDLALSLSGTWLPGVVPAHHNTFF